MGQRKSTREQKMLRRQHVLNSCLRKRARERERSRHCLHDSRDVPKHCPEPEHRRGAARTSSGNHPHYPDSTHDYPAAPEVHKCSEGQGFALRPEVAAEHAVRREICCLTSKIDALDHPRHHSTNNTTTTAPPQQRPRTPRPPTPLPPPQISAPSHQTQTSIESLERHQKAINGRTRP